MENRKERVSNMSKGHLGRSVSIIGAAYTTLGNVMVTPEIKDYTEKELFAQASLEAMENGGIEAKDIDAYYVGMSGPNYYAKIKSAGPFYSEWAGMRDKPTLFHDEGCATAGYGLNNAVMAVASGVYDCVLSAATNISSCVPKPAYPPHIRGAQDTETMWAGMWTGIDPGYEKPGIGGIGSVEAIIVRYAKMYGLSYKQIEEILVNYLMAQRKVALLNPKCGLVKDTYEEEAKRFGFDNVRDFLFNNKFNPPMGTLIRARFLGAIADGASAVIVCPTDQARKYVKNPVEVAGIALGTALQKTFMNVPVPTDVKMFKTAYSMAGITDPYKEVEHMGIHDCPATMVMPISETAGYIKEGEAWKYMLENRVGFDGDKPICTSGGRTQTGHPGAPAFGVEVSEAVSQMRGEAGPRQMRNPPKTSVIWGGGSGFNIAICVLKAQEEGRL